MTEAEVRTAHARAWLHSDPDFDPEVADGAWACYTPPVCNKDNNSTCLLSLWELSEFLCKELRIVWHRMSTFGTFSYVYGEVYFLYQGFDTLMYIVNNQEGEVL